MRAEVRHVSPTPSQLWETVEECVYAFELDFRDGQALSLEQYLPAGNATLRKTVLVELVKVDLELQWKLGNRIRVEEYPHRYSELGSLNDLPPDLIYEAYLIELKYRDQQPHEGDAHATQESGAGSHAGDGTAEEMIGQFCARFPCQRDAVFSLAHQTINQSTAITRQKPGGQWQVGARFGDFELLSVLGEGAFGKVFLAQQISLARQVALKITANRGSEARTMASLEHDNIVHVFSELVLPQHDARLLCMQYVPGTTLGKVIRFLSERPGNEVTGESIMMAIDQLATVAAALEAASLKERQQLVEADLIGAVTLLGRQLAEALSYAHERGVLHRDIKPDNVLISQYGRPLLVDFNLSLDPHQIAGTSAGMFGGSLAYMSPEHLDAFNPRDETTAAAVDQRSDIFSLGVALFELLHLRRPFPDALPQSNSLECLEEMAAQRRSAETLHSVPLSPATDALDAVIHQCLAPAPGDRFQTAGELCEALEAARELHRIRQSLPAPGRLLQCAVHRPLLMLVLAVLVPSLMGSGINISYNLLRIVGDLTADQMTVFHSMLLGYNLLLYPICIALLIYRTRLIFYPSTDVSATQMRQRIVTLPMWIVGLGAIGWLPGGFVFPLGLHLAAGPLDVAIFGHFLIDFALSGLIAVTYSYFGAEAILLRILYPRYLSGQPQPRTTARQELRRLPRSIQIAQVVAAIIPLLGAILIVLIGPADREGYAMFRFLVTILIALGMIGFSFSMTAVGVLQQTLQALTGTLPQRQPPGI